MALLRRLEKRILVPLPELEAREAMVSIISHRDQWDRARERKRTLTLILWQSLFMAIVDLILD